MLERTRGGCRWRLIEWQEEVRDGTTITRDTWRRDKNRWKRFPWFPSFICFYSSFCRWWRSRIMQERLILFHVCLSEFLLKAYSCCVCPVVTVVSCCITHSLTVSQPHPGGSVTRITGSCYFITRHKDDMDFVSLSAWLATWGQNSIQKSQGLCPLNSWQSLVSFVSLLLRAVFKSKRFVARVHWGKRHKRQEKNRGQDMFVSYAFIHC